MGLGGVAGSREQASWMGGPAVERAPHGQHPGAPMTPAGPGSSRRAQAGGAGRQAGRVGQVDGSRQAGRQAGGPGGAGRRAHLLEPPLKKLDIWVR